MRAWARSGRAPGRPLLSSAGRRHAAWLAAACLIVMTGLGVAFAGQHVPSALDRGPDSLIIRWLGQGPRVYDVTRLGTLPLAGPICIAAVAACVAFRRYRAALLVIIAFPVGIELTEKVLKPLFARTNRGALTYPSGHTITVTVMAVAAVVVLTGPAGPALPALARRLLAGAALATVPVVAVPLVAIRFHYLTDTIGAAALGTAVVLVTALAVDAACAWRAARALRGAEAGPPLGIPEPARELPPA